MWRDTVRQLLSSPYCTQIVPGFRLSWYFSPGGAGTRGWLACV